MLELGFNIIGGYICRDSGPADNTRKATPEELQLWNTILILEANYMTQDKELAELKMADLVLDGVQHRLKKIIKATRWPF